MIYMVRETDEKFVWWIGYLALACEGWHIAGHRGFTGGSIGHFQAKKNLVEDGICGIGVVVSLSVIMTGSKVMTVP